ncbi:MAG: UvrD-helicase domain-containing protein [Mycoplasmataceae bacterium]|nr:UvrD-helicase domain-containing protein [Mycoplasmataceae bacterium]
MFDINSLNEKQKNAVSCGFGPVMVIAGAGTGKTRVLTSRIIFLLQNNLVTSDEILSLTFTNKAANEMKKRILDSGFHYLKWMGTYSSICLRILKEEITWLNRSVNFTVMDEEDQLTLIREICKVNSFNTKIVTPQKIQRAISFLKSNMYLDVEGISYDKFRTAGLYSSEEINLVKNVFKIYQKKLLENNLVDFDDLLTLTLKIFDENKEVVHKWQSRFKYILVDEFQDTNEVQFKILMHLVDPALNNVYIVGDPDQTIYTWRGAYANIFRDFLTHFVGTKKFILDTNYRSSQKILDASNKLIRNNKERIDKQLVSNKGAGNNVFIYNADSQEAESNFIANEIIKLHSKYEYKDIAILYRANHLSRSIEMNLINRNIPYVVYGGTKFYQRKEIKDILAYLKILVNDDELSYKRIINIPKRNIGNTTVDAISIFANENGISFVNALFLTDAQQFNIPWNVRKIIPFIQEIESIKQMTTNLSVTETIKKIIEVTKYEDYLRALSDDFEQRLENISELLHSIQQFEAEVPELTIDKYLEKISLYTTSNEEKPSKDTVSLMTVHASKGLEFKVVFVISVNEGILPSKNATTYGQIEEERRIAYVAMTRAEEYLYITIPDGFNPVVGQQLTPSRFIKEIKGNYIQEIFDEKRSSNFSQTFFKTESNYNEVDPEIFSGDTIVHTIFGEGIVIGKNGDLIEVIFKNPHGIKTLNSKHKNVTKK